MLVVTSDHGGYLGDWWMSEKELIHDPSVKIPLIIRDPSDEGNATRGTTCDALLERIDLAPTLLDIAGGEARPHIIEGRSLLPQLYGGTLDWRL